MVVVAGRKVRQRGNSLLMDETEVPVDQERLIKVELQGWEVAAKSGSLVVGNFVERERGVRTMVLELALMTGFADTMGYTLDCLVSVPVEAGTTGADILAMLALDYMATDCARHTLHCTVVSDLEEALVVAQSSYDANCVPRPEDKMYEVGSAVVVAYN